VTVREVPMPALRPGWVLVANRYSLLSAGTERSKVELGQKNLLGKARSRPDLVRQVVDKARVEGVSAAVATTRDRLNAVAPIGYSSAGVVLEVAEGVEGLAPGDRVACAGEGWATHAEVIAVPKNLVARVPEEVDLADAAYATVGAIALHGVRRSAVNVGEWIGVVGLGLVGQLAARIAAAAGCGVIGIDLDSAAVELARTGGALAFERTDATLEAGVRHATGGLGLDAVLVCAAAASNDPLQLAARIARDRGRIVVVGDVPVSVDRALMYRKELEVRLSRSYGPGRYDRDYERRGRDFPAGYVRWTEQRNLQAFVDLVASGKVDPAPLTTHRFPVERAAEAYALLTNPDPKDRPFGILLEYEADSVGSARRVRGTPTRRPHRTGSMRIGVVGVGSFARGTLLPALADAGVTFAAVASQGGLSAEDAAARFGFERAADSAEEIFADDAIDAVVIATRHSDHASLTAAALRAGKATFVEKPLALNESELAEVEEALTDDNLLMVGFNRRFAPLVERLRSAIANAPERVVAVRVNAGPLEDDHWLHDPEEGGGRLLGEGCHFVDLVSDLVGSRIVCAHALAVPQLQRPLECSDAFTIVVRCADGSVGSVVYSGGGDPRLPKERIEAFGGGVSAVLDDYRRLELYSGGRRRLVKRAQDKGHRAQLQRFADAFTGAAAPPPAASYIDSTRATLALAHSLRTGEPVAVS
jgi:predicted dehydrogenase